jgi:AraC family transcriptional activator FtrA
VSTVRVGFDDARTISDMPQIGLAMHPHTMLYEVAIAAEVFGVDRSDVSPSGEWFELIVCTGDGQPHPWLPHIRAARYDDLATVDLIVVPSTDPAAAPETGLLDALRQAHDHGIPIASLCTGAFVLAAAGLLDGRTATTHWLHAEELARRHPRIDVRADVLYCDDGDVLTSAGKTAALDLCVHLIRRYLGATAANELARRLVIPAHRAGGQAQFITPPAAPRDSAGLGPALDWARHHLDQPLTVQALAREARLSSRQLARRMQAELHVGPLTWLHQQRIARAQELLERTEASVDQIAARCGIGTATTLRRHFRRAVGVTPTEYRASFRR